MSTLIQHSGKYGCTVTTLHILHQTATFFRHQWRMMHYLYNERTKSARGDHHTKNIEKNPLATEDRPGPAKELTILPYPYLVGTGSI